MLNVNIFNDLQQNLFHIPRSLHKLMSNVSTAAEHMATIVIEREDNCTEAL